MVRTQREKPQDLFGTRLCIRVGRGTNGTERGCTIRISSLNISLGWVGGLEADLWELHQGNFSIDVLQETKFTKGIHACYIMGYKVCVL